MTDMAVSRRYAWESKIIRIFLSFFIVFGVVVSTAPFYIVYASDEYGSTVTGCQAYEGVSEFQIDQDVYGGRGKYNNSLFYALFKRSSNVKFSNTCGQEGSSTSNISLLGETVFYKTAGYYSFISETYNALYDFGDIPVNNVDYLLGYLVNNGFDSSSLTHLSSDSSLLSWTTGNNPYTMTANNDVYIVGTTGGRVYYLSLSPDTVVTHVRGNTFTTSLTQTITYGNTTVYYNYHTQWSYSTSYTYGFNWYNTSMQSVYPYAGLVAFSGNSGSGSLDYGLIKDLQYSTNIIASGGSSTGDSNIDTISWYPFWDTNSNISVGWNIQVQVVPATYSSDTQENLFLMSINDLIINYSDAVDIYNGEYSNGSIAVSWGDIKQKLSILQWSDLFSYFDGTYWNKKGWLYRARYTDIENNYTSDWQVVYSVTSSNGEGVEKYIDPSDGTGLPGFYQDVENSFNTTSVVNNNYNVTHIYTGVPMTVNIDDTETSEDITQIKKYVKQIRDILINLNTVNSTTENNQNDQEITNNLNSVVGDLHSTEEEFMTDMDDKLNNIDRNVELLNDNKFIAAANWVRIQYDYLVSDTPFELLIVFGLILSLALIIIGKIR